MNDANQKILEDRISYEVLDPAFNIIRRDALSNILIPIIVITVMWSEINHDVLIAWCLLIIIGLIVNYAIARTYVKQEVPYTDAKKWGRRLSVVSLYFGVLWAAAVFLFYVDGSVAHQVFMYTLAVVLSIGSVISGLYWFPLFYLFAIPIMTSFVMRLAMDGSYAYLSLAVLMLWASVATLGFARMLNKTVRSETRLRLDSALLNEALELKTTEAEKAALEKSNFLAVASHDLRQPVHSLSLFIDVLKESKTDEERYRLFPLIDSSLDAMRKLFDALLDISRLDANVVKPKYTHFNLEELLKKLVEEFRPAANKKNLKIKVHAQSMVVVSDSLLLERVLRNLLSNAIRYTDAGGILLSCRQRGDEALVQVWDTGIGIPEECRDEVFVEFQQLNNSFRDRAEGIGLGLALVKRLCDLLRQPITLDSRPGRGSVFSTRVIRGCGGIETRNQSAKLTHSWDLSGRQVLVIDDEKDILQAMHALLSKWGCHVVTAETLEQALDELNRHDMVPELILSDLQLRNGKSGIEALDTLRQKYGASIAGIVISGDTNPECLNIVKDSDYTLLHKPVQPLHLRNLIQHYFSPAED